MEEATKTQNGGMLAVLGMDQMVVEQICQRYNNDQDGLQVAEVVNYNSPNQLVVSGTLPELEQIKLDIKAIKGKALPLNVAGAFHSRLMKESEKNFGQYLVKVDFKDITIPVVNNVEANIVYQHDQLKDSLVKQISSPVLWWPSMQHFKDMDLIIEVGPGDKLAKMLKREWPEKQIVSVSNLDDVFELLDILGIKMKSEEQEDAENKKVAGEQKSDSYTTSCPEIASEEKGEQSQV